MDLEESISISIPTIDEMPMMDFEKTPLGYAESAIKRYKEWTRNTYVSLLTITVEGEETANSLKAKIEECAKTEYDGRPQTNMEFAGAKGDYEGFQAFFRITVWVLKADEATRLGDTIKNFLRTQRNKEYA